MQIKQTRTVGAKMKVAMNKKTSGVTPRERLQAVLEHREPDRLCVDFGAGGQTGIGVCAVARLRQALLGDGETLVKVTEPYQMLGEVDEELRKVLELDVVGVHPPKDMFGLRHDTWKPFTMCDGTKVLVPGEFNWTQAADGSYLMYPEGDTSVPACAKMPATGYFWDALNRQEPLDESKLDPADNWEEFGVFSDADVQYFADSVREAYEKTDRGIYMTFPGAAFGDIALVPATWAKHPRGIRDVEEWYISTAMRRDYVYAVFERQCEVAIKNVEKLAPALGKMVQVAFVSGTDFGTQRGLFCSPKAYRDLYKPFQKAVNDAIHRLTPWKTFIHSCGAVSELYGDFIEAGFDVINPVQCSAEGMDPRRLKDEFGDRVVFWGGGVDTQHTLPFGTPDDVYREVRERIEILGRKGGFVFNSIHNVQSNVPTENLLAMFRAIRDGRDG